MMGRRAQRWHNILLNCFKSKSLSAYWAAAEQKAAFMHLVTSWVWGCAAIPLSHPIKNTTDLLAVRPSKTWWDLIRAPFGSWFESRTPRWIMISRGFPVPEHFQHLKRLKSWAVGSLWSALPSQMGQSGFPRQSHCFTPHRHPDLHSNMSVY